MATNSWSKIFEKIVAGESMPSITNLKAKVETLQQLLATPHIKDAGWQLALHDAVERVAEYSTNHSYSPLPSGGDGMAD